MRKTTLAAVFALLVGAMPLAATTATPVSAQTGTAQLRVVNALGIVDSDTNVADGPDADVEVDCATTGSTASIPVVQPDGTAADGSHDFTVAEGTCRVHVEGTWEDSDGADLDFECSSPGGGPKQLNFVAGHYYQVVIEPQWTTPTLELPDCSLQLWEDNGSVLPPNTARFTLRHAACETGKNAHITSVLADGAPAMGRIDSCEEATVELPAGFHTFTINLQLDPNGDGHYSDEWTILSPDDCDDPIYNGTDWSDFSVDPDDGCPTFDEATTGRVSRQVTLSLAAGESLALSFVDNQTGFFLPFLAGGDDAEDQLLSLPAGTFGPTPDIYCNTYVPDSIWTILGGSISPATSLVWAASGAPPCDGGGIGITGGAAATTVILDGNLLPASNPALQAFCTAIISDFQKTLTAETDYIKTLTVSDTLNTTLQAYVEATNALVQKLLTLAPADIRPAIVTLTAGITQLNQGLTAAGYNTADLGAANLLKIQNGLANPPANPEVDAARATLTSWVTGNCFASPADNVPSSPKFTG